MLKKASFLKEQTLSLIRSLEAHISEVTTAALGQENAAVNSPDETDNNDSSYIDLSNSIAVHMAKGTRVPGLKTFAHLTFRNHAIRQIHIQPISGTQRGNNFQRFENIAWGKRHCKQAELGYSALQASKLCKKAKCLYSFSLREETVCIGNYSPIYHLCIMPKLTYGWESSSS